MAEVIIAMKVQGGTRKTSQNKNEDSRRGGHRDYFWKELRRWEEQRARSKTIGAILCIGTVYWAKPVDTFTSYVLN